MIQTALSQSKFEVANTMIQQLQNTLEACPSLFEQSHAEFTSLLVTIIETCTPTISQFDDQIMKHNLDPTQPDPEANEVVAQSINTFCSLRQSAYEVLIAFADQYPANIRKNIQDPKANWAARLIINSITLEMESFIDAPYWCDDDEV